jgi:hypothetical protein
MTPIANTQEQCLDELRTLLCRHTHSDAVQALITWSRGFALALEYTGNDVEAMAYGNFAESVRAADSTLRRRLGRGLDTQASPEYNG